MTPSKPIAMPDTEEVAATGAEIAEVNVPTIYGAPEGQDARILADKARELMREDKILLHICLDDNRIATLKELLKFFAPEISIIEFPAWDCLPYDRVSPSSDIVARRVNALTKLITWESQAERFPRIVLTTVNAALQRVMPKDILASASFSGSAGETLDLINLQSFCAHNGYTRTNTVREAGEFAMRGGIIDIFPPGYKNPLRIDLFGNEIDTIREFDPLSQLSSTKVKSFALQPVTEFFLNDESIAKFRAGYREAFGVISSTDPLYAAISEGRRYNGMDHWLPLFYARMDTLFDYLPAREITFDPHVRRSHTERLAQIEDFFQSRKTLEAAGARTKKKSKDVSLSGAIYHPLPVAELYVQESEWEEAVVEAVSLSAFGDPSGAENQATARKGRDFTDVRAMPDADVFAELKKHITTLGQKTLITCASEGSMERMKGLLETANIKTDLAVLGLDHGFVAPDLAVITEQDILGDRLARKAKKRRKADNFLKEVSSLNEGDLVVHVDHGVGRFVALETLKAGKTLHDCLKIEYAGGDRLFVPVENIDVLSRFGAQGATAQLDKLGGVGWQARKASVKKNLMEMAEQLLDVAAARKLKRAQKLDMSEDLYNEFSARFPYTETEDQDHAIKSTLADIANDFPMDRLICGDVGFGKTEIAMRAAYVAAMEGVQVAIVVPTTLLARQHYQNFTERFAGTGLRIDQLSRMVTAKDMKAAKEGVADGTLNIAIGTHALFAKGMKFANLGLLIIDEEQKFGVKQKERLKELKTNVHILTLSATPIPRTLQMSLTGVKEMSLIATPPVDRLAIRTFVLPFDPMVVREALLREHYRGGQSFYVCPRVKDMDELEATIKDLVPEVKVISAHGQMTPTELEDRMNAFYDGQYDVLLATNIIESGIDIPTANTMIIHRADMFGLAQLYQIRGRIGRSKVRAYAYLTYPPTQMISKNALKRLEIMETLDTLGSGFQLASHDMDIRGAGNLLGDQQSGHIKEIGVELYQQMLEEAVAAAREGNDLENMTEDHWSPQINLGTSVLIPETYVEDLNIRMSLYRRLSDLENADEIEAFAAELIDRFGKLPSEVENLLSIVAIKQLCRIAGVSKIDVGPKGALLTFHNDTPANVEALMVWIAEQRGAIKLRPDQKLVAIRQWETQDERVQGAQRLMKELSSLG